MCVRSGETSAVFSSLPLAIKWLRDTVKQNQSIRFQVMLILLALQTGESHEITADYTVYYMYNNIPILFCF